MAAFVNPYNFVRSEYDASKGAAPLAHDRLHVAHYSGRMACTLTTITRVTTKSFEPRRGMCIYGSTLKGMVRVVAEAVAQGCFPLGGNACQNAQRLCICCRMFGWLKEGNVHLGRVQIRDATPQGRNWLVTDATYIEWQALSSPKRHPAFYSTADGRPRGRKFYYHHNPDEPEQKVTSSSRTRSGDPNESIAIAKAGETFDVRVDFTDLTSAELGLLLYALLLEEGLYHKVGKGKPLGFGTVHITLDTLSVLPPDRYEQWDTRLTPVAALSPSALGLASEQTHALPGTAVTEASWSQLTPEQKTALFIQTQMEHFFQAQFYKSYGQRFELPHMQDMRHLLSLHPTYPIHYPPREWFNRNAQVSLPTAYEVEGAPPGDRSAWLQE